MPQFDVIVIGAGPGGYVAAIRAAQLGLKTAVVDQWIDSKGRPRLGGTCLNVGCIPSKALLDSSAKYHQTQHDLAAHGIRVGAVSIDIATMITRKEQVVTTLTGGIETLFLKHKISWFKGRGQLLDKNRLEVLAHDGKTVAESLTADNIIIATGSRPRQLAIAPVDNELIVDSTGALDFHEVPKKMAVIGGGVIGLELGSVWQRLGAEVTILVRGQQFLPKIEPQIGHEALAILQQQGLNIQLEATPTRLKKSKKGITITYQQLGTEKQLQVDRVLVCAGREPMTAGLNAAAVGIELDQSGFIQVDALCQTRVRGIYAIGDVVRGPMLAHKASEEGMAVAERIAGQQSHVNYDVIPCVIYTHPEIAWVGRTTTELDALGIPYKTGQFPFKANGRAHAAGDLQGMVKLISDARTDRLLGAHILGPNASEMIAEAVVAMEFSASAEDIARTIHAHPTLSESFHEAALAVDRRTIHI